MILVFLFIAQTLVCANGFKYALANSNFTRLVVEKHHAMQNNSMIGERIDFIFRCLLNAKYTLVITR